MRPHPHPLTKDPEHWKVRLSPLPIPAAPRMAGLPWPCLDPGELGAPSLSLVRGPRPAESGSAGRRAGERGPASSRRACRPSAPALGVKPALGAGGLALTQALHQRRPDGFWPGFQFRSVLHSHLVVKLRLPWLFGGSFLKRLALRLHPTT